VLLAQSSCLGNQGIALLLLAERRKDAKSSSLHSPDGRLAEAHLRIRAIEALRVAAAQPP